MPPKTGVRTVNSITRCWWCGDDAQYVEYHDREWGRPVTDDVRLFEKICLEGFQAGLSWLTILRKRDEFRNVFHGFDPEKVAAMTPRDVNRLLENKGIVRHRGKIESTINNARRAIETAEDVGTLADYFWTFRPEQETILRSSSDMVATTAESTAMSKDLKRRGWSFVGPTTCYAFMQSMGLVNDHFARCGWRAVCEKERN